MLSCRQKLWEEKTCSLIHCLITQEVFIYGSLSGLGFSKGEEHRSISSGSHEVSATELSKGEGAQQWDAHLQVRDRPLPVTLVFNTH